jgi:hypothetical protein
MSEHHSDNRIRLDAEGADTDAADDQSVPQDRVTLSRARVRAAPP